MVDRLNPLPGRLRRRLTSKFSGGGPLRKATGRPAFEGKSKANLIAAIRDTDPPCRAPAGRATQGFGFSLV